MAQQKKLTLEEKVDDFISYYLKDRHWMVKEEAWRWKDNDPRVIEAFEALKDPNSDFAKEFGNQCHDMFVTSYVKKLIERGCALDIIISYTSSLPPYFSRYKSSMIDAIYDYTIESDSTKNMSGRDPSYLKFAEDYFWTPLLKRPDIKQILEKSDLVKLQEASLVTKKSPSLKAKIDECLSMVGREALISALTDQHNPEHISKLDDAFLDFFSDNEKATNFIILVEKFTEKEFKDFLDKKIESDSKSYNGHTKLTFFANALNIAITSPQENPYISKSKSSAAMLVSLTLGANREIKGQTGNVFDIMEKNRKQLDDLIELSDKIKSLTEQLAKSAVDGKHIYTTNSDDLYRFKRNITLMLVAGNVTQDPAFGKLIKDIVQNPGNDKNKELLKDLSQDIMKRSEGMIQGMSSNPFYRILQNIYNFCNAIYSRDSSIFIKGSVVLDTTKHKQEEVVESFAARITKELENRNNSSPAKQ